NIANISGKVVEPGKAPDRLLSVTLAEGSVLTGGANTDRVTATGLIGSLGTTTVTIDSTSRWAVTGSSWVTNLGNSGTVSLRDGKASGWTYKTLAVGNLDGSGAFVMGGDVVKRKGDLLDVALSSKGTFTIDYKNDPAAAAAPKNALLLVRSGETPVPDAANPGGTLPKGVFAATFSALPNSVEIGGFVYTVGRAADSKVVTINDPNKNNWYLYPAGQDPVPPTPTPTSAADAGMNMLYAHYLLGAQENHTLMQRMGELQRGTALSDGWVRFYGGKYDVSGTTARQPFDMSYWGVQAGYDRRSPRPDGSALYTGLFVGHTEGSPDFIRGSGNADATSLGLYGLWTSPSGFYADLVLKHTWHRGDYTVLDTKGKAVSANDVDTEGFGASLEVGRRFYLGADRQSRQGFYIEPQGQLSWNRYSSMDYRTSAGLRVHSDSYDSTVGRIGLVLGHNMVHGDRSTNVYGKIMYEKELGGDVTYRLNGVPVKEDFGGSWWTYGIGVTGQFGADKTYYLEVQRSDGDRFDQEWQINARLRGSF
ncbi:MAG TPA: hypothetical protein DIC53_06910, partial [Synergistaceae bacterium]|nr:hypothetical protein [Synergistaceae bacterium]